MPVRADVIKNRRTTRDDTVLPTYCTACSSINITFLTLKHPANKHCYCAESVGTQGNATLFARSWHGQVGQPVASADGDHQAGQENDYASSGASRDPASFSAPRSFTTA